MSTPSLPGYENLELIGKGGFSRVYRADQSKLKRKVAVKVLNFGLNDEADRAGFERETELMGRVSTHPNIVTVHDTLFTAQGQPCIVMEHYPGGSLADLLGEVGRLSTAETLEVGVAIAAALEASHQSGVLHCDLKPQNILISEFGQPALGDFGISTFAEERTRTGKDAGAGFTLPYAAPEIVEGESPTIASDVYSLAATLYTSLCGRRPFAYPTVDGSKPTAAEQARRILLEPVPSLVPEGVPAQVDDLIRSAMHKDPAHRPASAAAFAAALHRVGQQLGLNTALPRIADQGALPILEAPAAARGGAASLFSQPPVEASSSAGGDRTPTAPALADRIAAAAGAERGTARRRLAGVIAAGAVAAVVVLLMVVSRGGDESAADVAGAPVAPDTRVAADPVAAPTRPDSVGVARIGDHAVEVTWRVPEAELAAGDVVYEIRRRPGEGEEPVVSSTTRATLPAIADDEGVCVILLAVRANRTSQPTEPACTAALNIAPVLDPPTCSPACQVHLTMRDTASGARFRVTVLDRDAAPVGQGFDYAPTAVVGRDGATDWRLDIDETAAAGGYLVQVAATDGTIQTALLTVDDGRAGD